LEDIFLLILFYSIAESLSVFSYLLNSDKFLAKRNIRIERKKEMAAGKKGGQIDIFLELESTAANRIVAHFLELN
jgi:hypothetical protein